MLITGAGGRLGRLLSAAWARVPPEGITPLWQTRRAGIPGAVVHDPLAGGAPAGLGPVGAIVNLAGVTRGTPADLALNTDLALAALEAGRALGVRHVFLASSGAVYGAAPGPHGEADPPAPATGYGRAKHDMERAAQRWLARQRARGAATPGVSCLRIGNVAGADALLGGAARGDGGAVTLDRFADGQGPRRAYVGPVTLADTLAALVRRAAAGAALPEVLNLAAPGVVAMADLLTAGDVPWSWRPAPASALPELALDVARLSALCPPGPAPARPAALVAEWRALEAAP